MRFLRRIEGVTLFNKVRSYEIRKSLNIKPLLLRIERSQLRWFGHVSRMPQERLPKQALHAKANGRRPVGRPRTRLDRQPRRFIYPKDGGRFDALKMHVFTHLLRKCFTGKSKVRLRPPKSTIYEGSKWPLFTPKTAWMKIAQKTSVGVH